MVMLCCDSALYRCFGGYEVIIFECSWLTLLLSSLVSEAPTGLPVLLKLLHVCESVDLNRARTHGGRWHLERGL